MSLARTLLHAQRTLTRPASLLALARPSVPRLVVAQAFRPYADQATPAVAAAADVEATPQPAVEAEDQSTPPAAAAESAVESKVFVRKLPAGVTKEGAFPFPSFPSPSLPPPPQRPSHDPLALLFPLHVRERGLLYSP